MPEPVLQSRALVKALREDRAEQAMARAFTMKNLWAFARCAQKYWKKFGGGHGKEDD